MELKCLTNPEPAYDLPDFPEPTEPTTSVGKRAPLGIESQGNITYGGLQRNIAYGCLENVRGQEDYALSVTRAAIHTYEEVGNDTVASSILSNNVIQVPENVYATHCSPDSLLVHSSASSNDRYDSAMLLERRKPSGKYRKCGKQARDTTIALAALMSILLSGCVIVLSVTYLQAHHDQCSCTPESE